MERTLQGTAAALLLAAMLTSCASNGPCASARCAGDAEIDASVRAQLAQHSELQADQISVQVLDHVVYLRGLVDTDRERLEAEALARDVANVSDVVNTIAVRNNR